MNDKIRANMGLFVWSTLFLIMFGVLSLSRAQPDSLTAESEEPAVQPSRPNNAAADLVIDSISSHLTDLDSRIRSTLMFGGSSPVSFSGEGRLKLTWHNFTDYPEWFSNDRSYLQANYEGNESIIRLGMVVRAGRNAVLWSKIGFQTTFAGNRYEFPDSTGFAPGQSRHDKANEMANIHEDMSAGLSVRTVPASFWLRMGNVNWVQASPFTLWKSQPRSFAWDYLPYEIEQPIARYYEYNIALGEKSGRAAWNKKALNGINLESISLPWKLYADVAWGTYERYDNFEREYLDFANDLAFAGLSTAAKGRGLGDSYRRVLLGRVAREKLAGDATVGVNFIRYFYDQDIAYTVAGNPTLQTAFKEQVGYAQVLQRMFTKEPWTLSADINGALTPQLSLQAEAAINRTDTTWTYYDTISRGVYVPDSSSSARSAVFPALFASATSTHLVPVTVDLAYVAPGFYSPLSFAAPNDAFYPFGANLLGAGKFLGRGEASPYVQNMAGLRVTVVPKLPGYGHLKIRAGNHVQINPARDLIYFPYRLNGLDLFTLFQSSYNRWGNDNLAYSTGYQDRYRLADESYIKPGPAGNIRGPDAGGLRSDYMAMYEGFVPYESQAAADSNYHERTTLYTRSGWVPAHRKWTQNLELDASYDIGPYVHYPRDLLIGLYLATDNVCTSYNLTRDAVLWSLYGRLEPSIAVTPKFYLLGLLGYEVWRSDKAYTYNPDSSRVEYCPINYHDFAVGAGFDWDMLSRVGLHGRVKWMRHEDVNLPVNSWSTPMVTTEIKMWF